MDEKIETYVIVALITQSEYVFFKKVTNLLAKNKKEAKEKGEEFFKKNYKNFKILTTKKA